MFLFFSIQITILNLVKTFLKTISSIYPIISNQTSGYPNFVKNFEIKFANYIGKKYAITFSNGTSAMKSALFSLGLKEDDIILAPNYTFHSTVDPVLNLGHKLSFVNCNKNSLTIDIEDLKNKINEKVRCLIIVHPFGFNCNMRDIVNICKKNKIFLIEDCSHSHGSYYNGRKSGSFGNISIFSLQKNKSVSSGEGGIAVTNSKFFYLRMSLHSHFNKNENDFKNEIYKRFAKIGWGEKSRINPIGISLANIDLLFLEYSNKLKRNIFYKIRKKIKLSNKIFLIKENESSVPGGFFTGIPIIFNSKDLLLRFKNNCNLNSEIIEDPWYNLELSINYDLDLRKKIKENSLNKYKIMDKKNCLDYFILVIPFRKFGNTNYKKIINKINEFIVA